MMVSTSENPRCTHAAWSATQRSTRESVVFRAEIEKVETARRRNCHRAARTNVAEFSVLENARLANPAGRSARLARLFLEVCRCLGLFFNVLLHALQLAGGSLKARLQEPALAGIVRVEEFRIQAVHLALQRVEQQFVARERLLNRRRAILPVCLRSSSDRRASAPLASRQGLPVSPRVLGAAAGCDGAALVAGVPPRSSFV